MEFLQELIVQYPIVSAIFVAIGGLVTVASAIVFITPTKKDDEIVGAIIGFLERFSFFKLTEGIKVNAFQNPEEED